MIKAQIARVLSSSVVQSAVHTATNLLSKRSVVAGESGDDDDSTDDDDSFSASAYQVAITIFAILTFLIVVTILFELFKDWLLENASKYTKPIYLQLFSEMTVLGFLSLVTFAIAYGGTLDEISADIYGDSGEDYLESTLEVIHYLLFLVMILTIAEVMILVSIGNAAVSNFDELNERSQDKSYMKKLIKSLDFYEDSTYYSWFMDYVRSPFEAWKKYNERREFEETVVFYAMRTEFIHNRSPLPPFLIAEKDKQLPQNFDYGLYQAHCLSYFLVDIVSFTPYTWLALWLLTAVFFGIMMAADGDYFALSIVWIIIGYLDMFAIYQVKLKCHDILVHLVNPELLRFNEEDFADDEEANNNKETSSETHKKPASTSTLKPSEQTSLLGRSGNDAGLVKRGNKGINLREQAKIIAKNNRSYQSTNTRTHSSDEENENSNNNNGNNADEERSGLLSGDNNADNKEPTNSLVKRMREIPSSTPLWTGVEPAPPSWMSRFFFGNKAPNRHSLLFWADNLGPQLNIYLLRLHLIIEAVYITILAVFYAPYIFENYGYWQGSVYLVVGIWPLFIQFFGFYPSLIVDMSHVACTGLLRNKKTIQEIIRQQKAARVIKMLIMLTKLKASDKAKAEEEGGEAPKKEYDMEDPKIKAEVEEITRVFQHYDGDGSGALDREELMAMLTSMGMSLTPADEDRMFILLDANGDGEISLQEFIDWHLENSKEDSEEEMKGIVRKVFNMIDTDGEGEISLTEFAETLNKLDSGMTPEEIASLVRDFDEDGDGTISMEEFEKVIDMANEL